MTQYGTIPTSTSPESGSSSTQFITRAKERIKEGLGTRRPWKIMFNLRSISLPPNFPESVSRLRANVAYFRMNYAIIVLIIVFFSLLWHPISMIVFIAMMAAWVLLYFLRDEPLVIYGRLIDDRVVLGVLGVLTIGFLLLTQVTLNVVVSVVVGVVVVAVHGVVRKTDDLFLDEESTGFLSPAAGSS